MHTRFAFVALLVALAPSRIATAQRRASEPHHRWGAWDYASRGPDRWEGLSPQNAMCGEGQGQSPVALSWAVRGGAAEPVAIHYGEVRVEITNNGHTVLVPTAGGRYVLVDGTRFFLFQLHFHAPSEHTIDGTSYPMEIHLVHRTPEQRLLVLAIPVTVGEASEALEALWGALPPQGQISVNLRLDPTALLPTDRAALRYRGSLTTPPCSEPVEWAVLQNPITISQAQLDAFHVLYQGNRRPTQPLRQRAVRPARLEVAAP